MEKFRLILDQLQTLIEMQQANESQLKEIWNCLSSTITESEEKIQSQHRLASTYPYSIYDVQFVMKVTEKLTGKLNPNLERDTESAIIHALKHNISLNEAAIELFYRN
jgi:asparagine synthetase A